MNGAGFHPQWIVPDWPVPDRVRALITTRAGGLSAGRYDGGAAGGGMNIGLASGDAADVVLANRALLRSVLPDEPRWLRQVHGAAVTCIDGEIEEPVADAAVALSPGRVCVVSIADCLPVLFADATGNAVGVAHAGWRGLAGGVVQNTARELRRRIGNAEAPLLAYLGPAIGPARFEVGAEVLEAMRSRLPEAQRAFVPATGGKYFADLFGLARQALAQVGIERVFGGGVCTYSDSARFFSFRRDRTTGRHAALIWLDARARGCGIDRV